MKSGWSPPPFVKKFHKIPLFFKWWLPLVATYFLVAIYMLLATYLVEGLTESNREVCNYQYTDPPTFISFTFSSFQKKMNEVFSPIFPPCFIFFPQKNFLKSKKNWMKSTVWHFLIWAFFVVVRYPLMEKPLKTNI